MLDLLYKIVVDFLSRTVISRIGRFNVSRLDVGWLTQYELVGSI